MKKLLLIDGNAILHRAYHSLPPFKTAKGEVTNAIYGFLRMFFDVLKKEKPDYLAVAWDRAAPTFRHVHYVEYKATRAAPPDDLYPQLPRLKEVLAAFTVPMLEKDGFEADDILGTLAEKASKFPEMVTYILTGDRDALQLVNTRTHVICPIKGVSNVLIYTPLMVKEKTGVTPEQIIDYKALCGDVSDNIPGVAGIGPKRAAELLNKYGTLENIYLHLSELPDGIRTKLENGRESADLSQKIATISLNVPLEKDIPDLGLAVADYDTVKKLFTDLEFGSLLAKIDELKKIIPGTGSGEKQQTLF